MAAILNILVAIYRAIFGRDQPDSSVDVAAKLDAKVEAKGEHLNWRYSIVDLLKTLDLDSSLEARKDLAEELGNDDYTGTAEQNLWLHAEVMKKVANREFP